MQSETTDTFVSAGDHLARTIDIPPFNSPSSSFLEGLSLTTDQRASAWSFIGIWFNQMGTITIYGYMPFKGVNRVSRMLRWGKRTIWRLGMVLHGAFPNIKSSCATASQASSQALLDVDQISFDSKRKQSAGVVSLTASSTLPSERSVHHGSCYSFHRSFSVRFHCLHDPFVYCPLCRRQHR